MRLQAQRRDLVALRLLDPVRDEGKAPVPGQIAHRVRAQPDPGHVAAIQLDQVGHEFRVQTQFLRRAVEDGAPLALREELAAGTREPGAEARRDRAPRFQPVAGRAVAAEGEVAFQIQRVVQVEDDPLSQGRRHRHSAAS